MKLKIENGYGFIERPNRGDVFFHMDDLAGDMAFEPQLLERSVQFEVTTLNGKIRARNVRPI